MARSVAPSKPRSRKSDFAASRIRARLFRPRASRPSSGRRAPGLRDGARVVPAVRDPERVESAVDRPDGDAPVWGGIGVLMAQTCSRAPHGRCMNRGVVFQPLRVREQNRIDPGPRHSIPCPDTSIERPGRSFRCAARSRGLDRIAYWPRGRIPDRSHTDRNRRFDRVHPAADFPIRGLGTPVQRRKPTNTNVA